MQIFSMGQGWLIVAAYGVMTFLVTWLYSRRERNTKEAFLVADRKVSIGFAAFSIAATWIWAPALFVSAQKAYQQGVIGLFWFTAPNVLCLVLFGFFANRIRRLMPAGFSMSGFVLATYSKRAHNMFLIEGLGLQTCSFAVQLLAGAEITSKLTGIPFWSLTLVLAVIPLLYSAYAGLIASVATDYWQMLWIMVVGFAIIGWAVVNGGGWSAVGAGLAGVSGTFGLAELFSESGWTVFWSFGLPTTIGLLSGPFGDQMFWQRAFAIERHEIRRAFMLGALIFATTPLTMSLLGFLAAGNGLPVSDPQLVNIAAVSRWLPVWVMPFFIWMIFAGLISTVDSVICAVSSYAGHDLLERRGGNFTEKATVRVSRWSMLAVAILAVSIANIPGLKILHLFLFYGTLRASVLLPTVMTLMTRRPLSERGLFWGIVGSIVVGLPIMTYGQLRQDPLFISGGSLLTLLISGTTLYVMSRKEQGVPLAAVFDLSSLREE